MCYIQFKLMKNNFPQNIKIRKITINGKFRLMKPFVHLPVLPNLDNILGRQERTLLNTCSSCFMHSIDLASSRTRSTSFVTNKAPNSLESMKITTRKSSLNT